MTSRLGVMPDAMIASTYDADFRPVVSKRRSPGIPGYRGK
jgi:hypothetical protein